MLDDCHQRSDARGGVSGEDVIVCLFTLLISVNNHPRVDV